MKHAIYIGRVAHKRHTPKSHGFSYPFFMYFLNLDELDNLPDCGWLFSARKWAMSRYFRPDYYGSSAEPLSSAIKTKMAEITGHTVEGQVCGLMNLRTFGLYFSPVNFYYGFDKNNIPSHFLAEVSNIPWNERHQYAYFIGDGEMSPAATKQFKVSPFNPVEQHYTWKISPPGNHLNVQLEVSDKRGTVFNAALHLKRHPLDRQTLKKQLIRKPVMTASIVSGIYWQALKIYLKGVPYIPYEKEMI